MKKINIWYDKEGDYLEITLKKCKETYFNENKKDFAEIKDTKTQETVDYPSSKHKTLNIPIPN